MEKTNKVMSVLKITAGVSLLLLIYFYLHKICLFWEVRPYMYALEITPKFQNILGIVVDSKVLQFILVAVGYGVIPIALFSLTPRSKIKYSYFALPVWAAFYYGYVKYVLFAQRITGAISMKAYNQITNYTIRANRLIITPVIVIVSIVIIFSYAKRENENSVV